MNRDGVVLLLIYWMVCLDPYAGRVKIDRCAKDIYRRVNGYCLYRRIDKLLFICWQINGAGCTLVIAVGRTVRESIRRGACYLISIPRPSVCVCVCVFAPICMYVCMYAPVTWPLRSHDLITAVTPEVIWLNRLWLRQTIWPGQSKSISIGR